MKREILTPASWLDSYTIPDLPKNNFDTLWNLHPDDHQKVMIYGNLTPIPRFQRSYGHDYKFSGTVSKGYPLPPEFKPFVDWSNQLGYGEFNEILVNWYLPEHYIGSHADDEGQLVKGSPIVTITLCEAGELRKFRIRDKTTKKIVKDVLTPNGLVLIMGGNFQKEFKHEVVKVTGANAEKAARRISITLRQFKI